MPLLLPYAAIFMLASYRIDRYNLLRVSPRPTTLTPAPALPYPLSLVRS